MLGFECILILKRGHVCESGMRIMDFHISIIERLV